MDQYIGKILDNRYEILSVIGQGGMAVVYKARCHKLNRYVAIKILRMDCMSDEEIRRRFHVEAEAVAKLSSSNIVSVYDVGQYNGADYIVMELIDGITLKEYMQKRGGSLTWQESLHFMTQIMQALRHAHSRNIVHRDIKPQNIMVLRDGSVKVADFGIARMMDRQKTLTTEAFGSVHYVSPEQAKGLQVDARTDIYSAGVVLYEMLTGCLPFDGDTAVSIAIQHINSVPVMPRELNSSIPQGMEQICMKSMCARLSLRYQTADEVLQDLDTFRRNPQYVFPYGDVWSADPQKAVTPPSNASQPVKSSAEEGGPAPIPIAPPPVNIVSPNPAPGSDTEMGQDTAAFEEEERQHRKKARIVFTGAVIAIIAVILVIFFMLWQNFLSGLLDTGEVRTVPSLTNMTVDQAKEHIATQCGGHFTVSDVQTQADAQVEAGHIISQNPVGGSTTKSDDTVIQVIVSAGVQDGASIFMPSLIRQDYRTAETRLKNEYGVEVEYGDRVPSDTIDEGLIVSTDPIAGTPLEKGQTVTLYISSGSDDSTISMPSLIGMDRDDAKEALREAGLELGACVKVKGAGTRNAVIYQSVKPFTRVDPEEKIYLQVSDGSLSGTVNAEDIYGSGDNSGSSGDTTSYVDSGPVYRITTILPADGTASNTVTITVNGDTILNNDYPADAKSVDTVYSGEISSISVLINGVQTNDFSYSEIFVQ